jgi:hypothetical protein
MVIASSRSAPSIVRHIPTGRVPPISNPMPPDAYVSTVRRFPAHASRAFEEFIGDAPLVMHNLPTSGSSMPSWRA